MLHSYMKLTYLMDICIYIHTYRYISLGTLVPNSRDRQGKLWLSNVLENNLTIACPSNNLRWENFMNFKNQLPFVTGLEKPATDTQM